MAIRPIRQTPDPVLRKKAKRVPAIDKSIHGLIRDMIDTLDEAEGLGLAAPQVGVSLRVAVLHMPEEEPVALINPEVVKRAGEREVVEGCLSIPGYQGKLKHRSPSPSRGWMSWVSPSVSRAPRCWPRPWNTRLTT